MDICTDLQMLESIILAWAEGVGDTALRAQSLSESMSVLLLIPAFITLLLKFVTIQNDPQATRKCPDWPACHWRWLTCLNFSCSQRLLGLPALQVAKLHWRVTVSGCIIADRFFLTTEGLVFWKSLFLSQIHTLKASQLQSKSILSV